MALISTARMDSLVLTPRYLVGRAFLLVTAVQAPPRVKQEYAVRYNKYTSISSPRPAGEKASSSSPGPA